MAKLQVVSQVDLEQVLDSVTQLETPTLEQFAFRVNALLARRKAVRLPRQEAELLQKINQGPLQAVQERFALLNARRQAETLTAAEHQELLGLIDQVEQADAQRLQYLIELAQIRELSLDELMGQLGIQPPEYA